MAAWQEIEGHHVWVVGGGHHPGIGASLICDGCCGNVVGYFTSLSHLHFIDGETPVLGGFEIPQK